VSPSPSPLHPQARAFYEERAAEGREPPQIVGPVAARATSTQSALELPPGPTVASVQELAIPASDGTLLPGRRYEPHGAGGTIVWLHGGGWVLDGLELTDAACRLLANESSATVIAVDYRVAPEHRFPVPLDDCFDTLHWVAGQNGHEPLVVGGDSAGGNLAAVCALRARGHHGPHLLAQVLVYPVTDSDLDTPSYLEHGEPELPLLAREEMSWFIDCYARDPSDLVNAEFSPLRTPDLSGVAPAIVVVAEYDPLRDDSLRYAQRLRDAGVAVTTLSYDDMPHGFFTRPTIFDAGRDAVERVGAQLRELIAATQ
jgi:acetyl esterase